MWHARFVLGLVESLPLDKPEPIKHKGPLLRPLVCTVTLERSDGANMGPARRFVNAVLSAESFLQQVAAARLSLVRQWRIEWIGAG